MNLQTVIIILIVIAVVALFFLGREVIQRGIRVRHRLQMSAIYTNITHELLTPLTVISASVDRLREKEPSNEQDYDLMQLNIERMVRLLQQILETSKSQSGELKLRVGQGDVMQYIRQTAVCIEPLMAKKGLEFKIECVPESMMGWIDTDKLDKIIYNLLSNAAKYTQGENGQVLLQVHTNKRYDHIIIKVSDNGIGIPQDKMKKLFHRFYDGEYRQQQTIGTGLGLALTRELVYLHGGTIECDSKEGVGTTFTVTLPISKESFSASQIDEQYKIDINMARSAILDIANRMQNEQPQELEESYVVDDDAYKLLIVEDNVELLMLMNQLLSAKYHVYTASNGKEALKIIKKEELDIIISDVMMPVMDGLTLTKRVKSDSNYQHLPIILLTAKTQDEDRNEALQIGVDSYVTKPFKISDLELRINNIVKNRNRVREEFKEKLAKLETLQVKAEPTKPTVDDPFLRQAMDCVYKQLDNSEYDRFALASDMGASVSSLYNKLRELTGLSITNFIRDIRMKEAMRLAQQNPQIRVSDLAYKVGFKDPKYFSTCFKKEYGSLPTEFLERLSTGQ
jgi:DNA-binding response OmpR family regulator/anti-sigma regulatory factor (Ser/Thr protein kinase)